MSKNGELERAFKLMCQERWDDAIRELESLESMDWEEKSSPKGFIVLIKNMKAEALVKTGDLGSALSILEETYRIDPETTSQYLAKLALEYDLSDYYHMAAAGIEMLLKKRVSGTIADILAQELEETLGKLKVRIEKEQSDPSEGNNV